uniref:Uncharacterized protein n=1 Tax=Anguilla anguilla TaxID=7936 RepID=A0A0E9WFC8_ANGAN
MRNKNIRHKIIMYLKIVQIAVRLNWAFFPQNNCLNIYPEKYY